MNGEQVVDWDIGNGDLNSLGAIAIARLLVIIRHKVKCTELFLVDKKLPYIRVCSCFINTK